MASVSRPDGPLTEAIGQAPIVVFWDTVDITDVREARNEPAESVTPELLCVTDFRCSSGASVHDPAGVRSLQRGRVSWVSVKGQGDSWLVAISAGRFGFVSSALVS